MNILIGYSGFVGSNLNETNFFDKTFNSSNIQEAYDLQPDICVYAGIRAQKFIANKHPESDLAHIKDAIENIKKIKPKKLILISTIDVLDNTNDTDEFYSINTETLEPYGKHRRYLEMWVEKNISDYHIIRLPGLYGKNLKKNFIFDLLNPIPKMLTIELFNKLNNKTDELLQFYELKSDHFYYLREILNENEHNYLQNYFHKIHFSAKLFTDSRIVFQFYNLKYLWNDIQIVIANDIKLIHLVTEPISASELYQKLFNEPFINEKSFSYPKYNIKTKYASYWNGKNGYLDDKQNVIEDIKIYVMQKKRLNI